MRNNLLQIIFMSLAISLFLGCSSSDDSSGEGTAKGDFTGQLIDSPIVGMPYECSSKLSGETSTKGDFICNSDDTITFTLGGHTFDPVKVQSIITPQMLFGGDKAKALNFAQLMQTLDSDGDLSNGITPDVDLLKALGDKKIDFAATDFDEEMKKLLGVPLVSEEDAQQHLDESFATLGINADGSKDSEEGTGAGTPDTIPPVFKNSDTASVNENALTVITITTNETTVLSLSGSDASLFKLVSNVLSFKVAPDYESDPHDYSVTVTAIDVASNSTSQTISITLVDVDETVPDITAPTITNGNFTVDENQQTVGVITTNEVATLSLSGADAALFTLTGNVLSFINNPDFETKEHYTISVTATDIVGNQSSKEITVTLKDLDEIPPIITSSSTPSADENQKTVLTITANETVTLGLSGTHANLFELTGNTLSFTTAPDYESDPHSYSLTITATDLQGNVGTQNMTVVLQNIIDAKPILLETTLTASENAKDGDKIGNILIQQIGDAPITSFVLNAPEANYFRVDTDGNVTVTDDGEVFLFYEETPSYTLEVTATNALGISKPVSLIINVQDENIITPVFSKGNLSVNVAEDIASGAYIGVARINIGDSYITNVQLTGVGSDKFLINKNGSIYLKTAATLDYETTTTYNLQAVASNLAGNSDPINVTIHVDNVAEVVATLAPVTVSIREDLVEGNPVANIPIINTGDTPITNITFNEVFYDFFIINNDGNITLSADGEQYIDYEERKQFNFTATATNDAGVSAPVAVTINIENVAETVPLLEMTSLNVAEDIASGTTVGQLTISEVGDTPITAINLSGVGADTFVISNSGIITLAAGKSLDFETTPSYNLSAVAINDAGNSEAKAVVIDVTNVAEIKPTLASTTSLSVSENAEAGSSIGSIQIIESGDTSISAILLSGTGHENFTVSTSGLVSVSNTASLDYETTQLYNLTAIATNGAGDSIGANLSVGVTNTADVKPNLAATTTLQVDENVPAATVIGTVSILAVGDSPISSMRLSGSGSTKFDIDTDGVITLASSASLDYEDTASYLLDVIATNEAGEESGQVTININNLYETVPTLEPLVVSIPENSDTGTIVDSITITASGDSPISAITLSGSGKENFTVSNSALITVKTGAVLDYETTPSFTLSAIATNEAGNSAPVSVTVNLTNIAEIEPTLQAATGSVQESASAGTLVGTITITDQGDTPIDSILLTGTGHSNFTVALDGKITVARSALLDYETTALYNLQAVATNAAGNSAPVAVNINITNVADVVPTLEATTLTVDENSGVGTVIGRAPILDNGDSSITLYHKLGLDSVYFDVDNSGIIRVASGVTLDYETQALYTLEVSAENSAGESAYVTVSIQLTNIAETPPTLESYNGTVTENVSNGTIVGTLNITDSGDTDISNITFFASPPQPSCMDAFAVSLDGVIRVADTALLDYEVITSCSFNAKAINDAGESNSITVDITITDIADVLPYLEPTPTLDIAENAISGTLVGTLNIQDVGDTPISNITLTGTGQENFDVALNGTVTLSAAANLDYETTTSYTLQASVTNDAGSVQQNITIDINNIPNTVAELSSYSGAVSEDSVVGTTVGSLSIVDYGDEVITSITLSGSGNENFTVAVDGTITLLNTLDYETTQAYNLTAVATNTVGDSLPVNVTISVTDVVDTVPTLSSFTTNIQQDTAGNSILGTLTVDDIGDASISGFTLSGANAMLFNLSSSGELSVAASTTFDYATTPTYTLSAYATNSAGNSQSVDVIINIIDPNGPPTATLTTISGTEDTVTSHTLTADSYQATTFTYEIVTPPTHGTVIITNPTSGAMSYEPSPDYNGADSFTYRVKNSDNMWSDIQTVNVSVSAVNDAPTYSGPLTFNIDERDTWSFLLEVQDIDSDTLTFSLFNNGGLTGLGAVRQGDKMSAIISTSTPLQDFEDHPNDYSVFIQVSDGSASTIIELTVTTVDIYTELYVRSVAYNRHNTSTPDDDEVFIYFNQDIDPTSINTDRSMDYDINGTGAIGTASGSDYESTIMRHKLSLNSDGSTSVALIPLNTRLMLSESSSIVTPTGLIGEQPESYAQPLVQDITAILKTGATTSYHLHDDGTYKLGTARSYSVYNPKFTPLGDRMIKDNNTGLIWQDAAIGLHAANSGYCSGLSFGNKSDWRKPTLQELENIIDFGDTAGEMIDTIFTGGSAGSYWSATYSDLSHVYSIDFTTAQESSESTSLNRYIRCVR